MTERSMFYVNINKKINLPIYTMRLPGSRAYIVNATEFIPLLQRQWRTISFTPILASSGPAVMGISEASGEILHRDMKSDSNSVAGFIPAILPSLAPGPSLDSMNRKAVEVMAAAMDVLRTQKTKTMKFWEWTHHEILMATTDAVYGPQNPYRNVAVEAARSNTFGPSYMKFALSPFKSILAPKAYRARELLASAWLNYLQSGGHESASEFAKSTHSHNAGHGFSVENMARTEIGHSFATVGTTALTSWWLMYHIFSDPVVLADIRKELSGLVVEDEKRGAHCIDMSSIRTACPIFLSTFKETMRYRGVGTSVRLCLEDHMPDGRYLLKKGSLVITPQLVQHTLPSVWGDDAETFNHLRFVPSPGRKRPNLQFDLVPTGGKWIQPRDGREWRVSFSGSNEGMEITSEDMDMKAGVSKTK
ncbi:Cytochrome P450 monooxygenase nodJ-like protein [Cladobotryum mycophilum]|uniref:Cytochrome P450 monooxygenase nodJ-like protein n=1 Tax=Cladobotryum mycophilum TaxID=491253 RepID=A0ABR0SWV8_9HYPO